MDRYREEIKKYLLNIPDKGRVLFAAITCERLYPNYVAFQQKLGWGNHEVLLEGIALIRQYLIKEDLFDKSEIIDQIDRIDEITPNTEDFSDIITSFALDACTSIDSTLNYLLDKNTEHIADVATYSRDTVDMYVQEIENIEANDPDTEKKIATNKFMVREKKAQEQLLKKLSVININAITDKMIETLADRTVKIDLELLPNRQ